MEQVQNLLLPKLLSECCQSFVKKKRTDEKQNFSTVLSFFSRFVVASSSKKLTVFFTPRCHYTPCAIQAPPPIPSRVCPLSFRRQGFENNKKYFLGATTSGRCHILSRHVPRASSREVLRLGTSCYCLGMCLQLSTFVCDLAYVTLLLTRNS